MVKVSIIVPVYNVERYIDRCINSILSQSLQQLELILVDDGSSDYCPEICDRYASLDARVKVVHQQNAGVSSARNMGLSLACGEYIGFVDADDYIDSDMFLKLYNAAKENDAPVACCNLNFIDERGNVIYSKNEDPIMVNGEELFKRMFDTNAYLRMGVWNKIYRSDIIVNRSFECDKHMAEDLLFLLKVVPQLKKVVYIREGLYYYFRQREGAATSKAYSSFERERVENTHFMAEYIRKNYSQIYPQAAAYKCINGDLTAINKMIDAGIRDTQMIKIVKEDLSSELTTLKDSNISNLKMLQIYICSKSFFLYKLIYKIIK